MSDRDGDFEVYTMRPNGSNVRQLTFNDAHEFRPNWSPDSRMISFASDQDGDFEVYVHARRRHAPDERDRQLRRRRPQRLVAGRQEDRLHQPTTSTSSR